jgi:glutaminase
MTASLVYTLIHPEMSISEKFDYVHEWYTKIAGGEKITFDNSTFLSEREAADRNYALGFYMKEVKAFPEKINLKECMDFYFQVRKLTK